MRSAVTVVSLLAGLAIATAGHTMAAEGDPEPLFVNYGKDASPRQGDNDHHQAIYFSVPAATTGKLYLRVFDPDTINFFDKMDRAWSVTRTRFTVFGGDGAFIAAPSDPEKLTAEELTSGTKLAENTFGRDRKTDDKWVTLAELDPAQGQRLGDRIVFRLVVDALTGVNGNVFNLGLSLKTDENAPPDGLRMFSYTPTVRMPRRGVLTEVRFAIPKDAQSLTIGNFDAAFGTTFFTTPLESIPLTASGQGQWARTTLAIGERYRGTEAAVTLSGGKEYPNDATFYVADDKGRLLPFELPAKVFDLTSRPVAVAAADLKGTCTTVSFDGSKSYDVAGRPVSYVWRFGDGESQDGQSAVHDYKIEGRIEASLEATDTAPQLGNGSVVSLMVFVKKPPVALSDKRLLIAQNETVPFDGAPSTASKWTITENLWDFGDGTKISGSKVDHAFAKPGVYEVTHTVVDDSGHPCNTATEKFSVRVNAQPVAEAGPDQHVSVNQEVAFDAGASTDSDGKIVDYQWDFGDGSKASGAKVTHKYAKAATYKVTLAIRDDSDVLNSGAGDSLAIIVNDPPIPEAGADKTGAIGEPLTFDASGSVDRDGRIIAYDWDFGDGSKATGVKVTHAYAKSGTYTVKLTVTDDSTTDTSAVGDSLSVRVNEPPVAKAGPDQLVTASLVQFDGSASGDQDDSIAKYEWDFGDGGTGTGPKPTHVYTKPGTYTVRLTVTDASKTIRSSASNDTTIVVNAVPIADAGPDLIGAPGEGLVFSGARSVDPDGEIADYHWEFGDGSTGSGQTVKHAFAKSGTYKIRLKVQDNTKQDAAVDFAEAEAFVNQPPVADAGPDVLAAPGQEVDLSAANSYDTDGEIASYRWDFNDQSEPADTAEVKRTFAEPGIYTAQLTVTDDSSADNAIATDSVKIAINHAPVADAGPDIVSSGTTITFDGTRSVDADGDALAYSWDFGDGQTATGPIVTHTYAEGGTYPVVLLVNDGTKLANATGRVAISLKINRPPVAVAGKNERVCTGDTVVLDGSRSSDPEGGVLRYSWTFGDGRSSDIVNPTVSYNKGGTYPVTLTVQDNSGLPNGSNSSQIAVRVDQGPVASAGKDILACAKTEVAFDGSASSDIDGVVNNYAWDFGDGNFGGGATPTHIYEKPGTYRVFLKIDGEKAGICPSTSSDEVEVKIIEGPVAVIKAPDAVPLTDTVAFDGAASYMKEGQIIDWHWDFGDGESADGPTASHRYAQPGRYQVALTLKSDSPSPTCQLVSARHLIMINAPPVAVAGADKRIGVGEETVFDASASKDQDGGIVSYDWDFGDGSKASGIEVAHTYEKPGSYTAKLTVRDEADLPNSSASDEVAVTVNPAPAPAIAGPDVACVDEQATWQPGATDPAGDSYRWVFGDGATADSKDASHAYKKPGWYSLALFADDGKGLANSKQESTKVVHINQPPHPEAGSDQLVCPGDTVGFDGSASRDLDGKIKLYHWDFGDGATLDGDKVAHVFDKPGTYKVTLTVTDDQGSTCSATTDSMDVVVNAPPVPDAGKDRDVFIGGANDAVLLDGSASSDADGGALTYTWQIGDGGSELGERVRHTFTTPGKIPVTLTVADTSGLACGTAATTVNIVARPRD